MTFKAGFNTLMDRVKWFKSNRKILVARLQLRVGAYFIRKGALLQPGQPLRLPKGKGPSLRGKGEVYRNAPTQVWIENMFFNFRHNKITYQYSDKPIKGLSEQFVKASPKK